MCERYTSGTRRGRLGGYWKDEAMTLSDRKLKFLIEGLVRK